MIKRRNLNGKEKLEEWTLTSGINEGYRVQRRECKAFIIVYADKWVPHLSLKRYLDTCSRWINSV